MPGTNIHDAGRGRYAGGETPTNDDHLATKKYVDDNAGSPVDVTDGTHTVTGLTELDFTSGATVTDAGGGVAQVAIAGGGSQTVETATRAFTSAEILSLSTVPIELVPAPGAGFVLVPLQLIWIYRFVTTHYDADGALDLDWTGGSLGLCSVNGALFRSEDRISYSTATAESRKILTTAEGLALKVQLQSAVTGGDGTGFAVVQYTIVPLA